MRRSVLRVIALLVLPGLAEAGSFTPVGNPDFGASVAANGVSADGKVVVGGEDPCCGPRGFRWTSVGGIVGFGDGLIQVDSSAVRVLTSEAFGVSADGEVVVGNAIGAGAEAYRWTSASGMVGLGDLPGGTTASRAYGVSADGEVVVGDAISALGNEAFRWTSAGGMVGLGSPSVATGVSADGEVVIGYGDTGNSFSEAFRWTSAGGMVGLGDLPGGTTFSRAYGVSANGEVVVGDANSALGNEAFRWTSADGMVGLGDLPGGTPSSRAYGVSADGEVVVGEGYTTSGQQAFVWTLSNGMKELSEVLVTNGVNTLGGWTLLQAKGISADGQWVVGNGINPQGQMAAFLANISADLTPDPFFFLDPSGVPLSAVTTSAPVTISGVTGAAPVTVAGGEYSVGCGAVFTSAPGIISNGQPVCVKQTSAATNSTATSTTLTVGEISDTFTTTTVAASSGGGGGGGLDGFSVLILGLIGAIRRKAA